MSDGMREVFLTILRMSFVAGYVILVVLFVRRLLRRFPKRYSYLLWSVVFFRLVCPFGTNSPVSLIPERLISGADGQKNRRRKIPGIRKFMMKLIQIWIREQKRIRITEQSRAAPERRKLYRGRETGHRTEIRKKVRQEHTAAVPETAVPPQSRINRMLRICRMGRSGRAEVRIKPIQRAVSAREMAPLHSMFCPCSVQYGQLGCWYSGLSGRIPCESSGKGLLARCVQRTAYSNRSR